MTNNIYTSNIISNIISSTDNTSGPSIISNDIISRIINDSCIFSRNIIMSGNNIIIMTSNNETSNSSTDNTSYASIIANKISSSNIDINIS